MRLASRLVQQIAECWREDSLTLYTGRHRRIPRRRDRPSCRPNIHSHHSHPQDHRRRRLLLPRRHYPDSGDHHALRRCPVSVHTAERRPEHHGHHAGLHPVPLAESEDPIGHRRLAFRDLILRQILVSVLLPRIAEASAVVDDMVVVCAGDDGPAFHHLHVLHLHGVPLL